MAFANNLQNSTREMMMLTILAAIIPSIICFFKPFQDYGSSEVYIWSNLPLGLITLVWGINEVFGSLNTNISDGQVSVMVFMLVDLSLMGVSSFINKLNIARKVKPKFKESALFDGFMTDFGMAKNVAEIVRFVQGTSLSISKSRCGIRNISIMCNEIHTQSFAEVIISYINKLKLNNLVARPGFTPIDNYKYGYFLDYVGFTIDPGLTLTKIKPDILILNSSVGYSNMLLQNFKRKRKHNIIYRSGDLYVISVSGRLKIENGQLAINNN